MGTTLAFERLASLDTVANIEFVRIMMEFGTIKRRPNSTIEIVSFGLAKIENKGQNNVRECWRRKIGTLASATQG